MGAMIPSREGETMDIVRYAEVMAHLRHFPADKHAEVIARLGIRRRDWDASAVKWKRVRDAERYSGKLDVTIHFGRVMSDTRVKLEAQQPPIESLGQLPGPDDEAPAEAAAHERASAVPIPEPWDASSIAPTPAVVPVPARVFDREEPASAATLVPPLQTPEMRWARWAGTHSAVRTANISMFRKAALPFRNGRPAAAFFAAADAARAEPRGPRASATGLETMPLGEIHAMEGDRATNPLDVGAGQAPSLTVEQYAAFCAELEVFPSQAAQIHRTYGVAGADARRALDDAFARRFRADPPLQRTWEALVAHYGQWYRARAPR
jgi:hypothetical protein